MGWYWIPFPETPSITGTHTSRHYTFEVLQPVFLPYLQNLSAATFQQDIARPHVARNIQAFFLTHHIELLHWPLRSLDLSPIEQVWSMTGERLVRHAALADTPAELCYVCRQRGLPKARHPKPLSLNAAACSSGYWQTWRQHQLIADFLVFLTSENAGILIN